MADGASPVVSIRNFSKRFGGRTVLDSVDLDVAPGEIHGLVGQNGSGKSTLIKILAGYHAPEPGAGLHVRSREVHLPTSAFAARHAGLSFVHQDLGLIDSATVMENLRVGLFDTGAGWRVSWREERRRTREALDEFGIMAGPDTPLSTLREVDRALVAIVRGVEHLRRTPGGLLVLDEPTAYLPRDGVSRLFHAARQFANQGSAVLFVSHRLDEVRQITDRVTVLRDGKLITTTETASLNESGLIELILGVSLDALYPAPRQATREALLHVRGLSGSTLRDFSVDVARGEIVGVTGLVGMGYEEIPYLLFGAETAQEGTLELEGNLFDLPSMSPRQAMGVGLALLPANRLRYSGAGDATMGENVSLTTLGNYFRGRILRHRWEAGNVKSLLEEFQVSPPAPNLPFRTFSGGNQQKALLGKWFARNPSVFVLHEPTQGVDIGARRQIFRLVRDLAANGTAIIYASAEYEDLAHLCDRVIVLRDGRVVSELHEQPLSKDRIVEQCFREGVRG